MLALTLLALLADHSSIQAQQPGQDPLTFTAAPRAPVFEAATKKWNYFGLGGFTGMAGPLEIQLTLRETPLNANPATTFAALRITEQTPVPPTKQAGIIRQANKMTSGSYSGGLAYPRYDTTTCKYEMKFEFYSSGLVFYTYKENNKEWIPVPAP